jgi:DNA repair exonuclease SbcCD ATPase subunit
VSRYFLTRLKVEGFRGINNETDPLELTFKPGAVNSVFAINGVGKSSLFEALCFAIKGTIPKLDALQVQERPQDYYCNRFHSGGHRYHRTGACLRRWQRSRDRPGDA